MKFSKVDKFLSDLEAGQGLYTQKYVDEKDKEIERLNNLLNQADSKNLELIEEINEKEDEIERLKNVIKRITEITNQKIKVINDIIEYMNTNVNANINHIYEILEKENK